MNCLICKRGTTAPGTTTLTLERGAATFVIRAVPAQLCQNCGEAYLDDQVAEQTLETAEQALKAGVRIEVRDYVAAY